VRLMKFILAAKLFSNIWSILEPSIQDFRGQLKVLDLSINQVESSKF
jgi:hypothetical protein